MVQTGCAGVGIGAGGDDYAGDALVGDFDGQTTELLDLEIEQNASPVQVSSGTPVSVGFAMRFTNVAKEPDTFTIHRISLESMGNSPVTILPTRWNFNKQVKPGVTEEIEFWARVDARGSRAGANVPILTRATVLFSDSSGKQTEALFTRRVNGRFVLAVGVGG